MPNNNNSSNHKQQDIETSHKLAAILDELLESDDWDQTLYLRAAKKRLLSLRDRALNLAQDLATKIDAKEPPKRHVEGLEEGYVKIYISLYQTDGSNLPLWQNILKSLAKYSVSRPIYANEEYLQELIRTKAEPTRHGYAVVAVKEGDIIKSSRPILDPLGHDLIALRENAVALENILEFVHANTKRFTFTNGVLKEKKES